MHTNTQALRTGVIGLSDSSSVVYAVFDRGVAEAEVGWKADTGNTEFAERLTGWRQRWVGAGHPFADDPQLKVYGRKVLVFQRRGIDI